MRILISISISAAVFLAACAQNKSEGRSTDIVNITKVSSGDVKSGSVALSHEKHEAAGVKCITCHHKKYNDEREKRCSACHQEKEGYETIHGLCIGCHRDQGRGPVKCESCHTEKVGVAFDHITLPKTGHRKLAIRFNHKAHSENYGATCKDCHHKGGNENCANCHQIKDRGNVINLKGAYHQQCHDCHRKTSGPKGCGKCHKTGEDASSQ